MYILRSYGKKVEAEAIERVDQERVRVKKVPFEEMNPDVLDLLQALKGREVQLGLISNCAPEEVSAWKDCRLAKFFDDVIFSYQVKCAKPDPHIYKMACERLGVTPEESIFIGDGGSNELRGAAEAGMKAFHATWFLPEEISSKIYGYPKLKTPSNLLIMELARH